jgi:hypothetical protein
MHLRLALLLVTIFALAPLVSGAGKKEDKATVSFHMETEATDNPKMIFQQLTNGQPKFFRRMPEINVKDILSFSPFPSATGGDDYGVVFKLKANAARRLSAVTSANQGRWMIAQVNGRVVDGVLIDQQIDDGLMVVWKGITLADMAILDASFPRIGQEGQKKKKK